jgi:hypothetical protein
MRRMISEPDPWLLAIDISRPLTDSTPRPVEVQPT